MAKRLLLFLLTGAVLPALAQRAPARPGSFPVRHRLAARPYGPSALALPNGLVLAAAPAPLPTVRAAAACAPWPASASQRSAATDTLLLAPRYHPAGTVPAPAYDIYENLPEEFRRHTLRASYTEPLLVQLLRGALGR